MAERKQQLKTRFLSSVFLAGGFAALLALTPWFKINVEPSVLYGLYCISRLPATLERGMLVTLPTPEAIRPWHPWWIPLLKPIAGLPGDQVCVLSVGMWIDGQPYGLVYERGHGKPLPRLRGCFTVPDGHVWLATKTRQTLDSRYYGAIPFTTLTAQAHPLWTLDRVRGRLWR